jgi:hypothetical protein
MSVLTMDISCRRRFHLRKAWMLDSHRKVGSHKQNCETSLIMRCIQSPISTKIIQVRANRQILLPSQVQETFQCIPKSTPQRIMKSLRNTPLSTSFAADRVRPHKSYSRHKQYPRRPICKRIRSICSTSHNRKVGVAVTAPSGETVQAWKESRSWQ